MGSIGVCVCGGLIRYWFSIKKRSKGNTMRDNEVIESESGTPKRKKKIRRTS